LPQAPKELSSAIEAVEALLRDEALAPWPTREDDLALLQTTRERLERRFTLAVVGEFSSGKSYLLNALLGKIRYDDAKRVKGLLATDINPSTATITELEYGTPETATAKYASGRSERIPLDALSRFVAVGKNEAPGALHDATADKAALTGEGGTPEFVTVAVDSLFLRAGFTIADTPGLASPNPAHRRATLGYLPRTDAVLYLIDTQQPFTEGDAAFLGLIGEHVRTIFIVQTKIDLWRLRETDGRAGWQIAGARIAERAARFAPGAEVYAVSARDYAVGTLEADETLMERSGFPALLAGLEHSVEARALEARVERTLGVLRELTAKTSTRVRRSASLSERDETTLAAERTRALEALAERESALAGESDEIARAGERRRDWIRERGATLAARATRALAAAIDVADIERIRDRGRFHALVDATVVPVWTAFANEVAGEVSAALAAIAASRPELRVADVAALRLGGEPGTGAWSRDLASGIASTIVLGAIGGPTVDFVHGVARRFAAHPHGTYMKRELGADLKAALFPAFEQDIVAFVATLAAKLARVYDDCSSAVEREREIARAETIDPIDRALALARSDAARRAALGDLRAIVARLGEVEAGLLAVDARLDVLPPAGETDDAELAARADTTLHSGANGPSSLPFDADAYDRGLRPERYRVVVLGALRRGKSSLINAIAGTRLLQDEGAAEALFPIHVRFGERERAYALEREGEWHEIATSEAMAQAARTPVLIETPWSMPRQLVLVHAPAFDSGNEEAESIALAAARAASEILGLFSRQLSDRELALYARVSELPAMKQGERTPRTAKKPMLLAHTIADNESASERRTVVELAARYLRERGITVNRIFTISALDYLEAAQSKRPAEPWNELGALRDTLAAHAEEHMNRLNERERRASGGAPAAHATPAGLRRAFLPQVPPAIKRLFGRKA